MDISGYKRNSNKFSFTDTFGSLVGNSEFGEGYVELKNKKHNEKTYIWEMLSAVSEEIGETLYENVLNYIDNVSNIDTCNIKALKSIAEMLGTEDFFFFNSVDKIPLDILNLINIFSIKRRYLLNSSLIDSKLVNEIILNTFNFNDITSAEKSISAVRSDNITHYGNLLSSDEDLDLSAKSIDIIGSIDDDKFTEFIAKVFYDVIAEHIADTYVSFDDISANNGSIDYSCLSAGKDGYALNFVALNIKNELKASNKTGLRNIFDSQDTLLDSQISVLRKNSNIPPNIDFRFIAYKIDKGIDSIEEYSEDEQKIINLILENWSRTSRIKGSDVLNIGQLSSNEFKYVPLLQTRYAIYKEQLVKSYINYIEDIFQLSSSGSLNNIFKSFNNDSPYDLDKNYTDITYKINDIDISRTLYDFIKEENLITLKYPNQNPTKHYENPIIKNVSAILAKICLVIANIREQLKSQAQKNHMVGTRLLLEYILSRYIKSKIENNIYPSLSGDRLSDLNLDIYKHDSYDPTTGALKTEYTNGGKFFVNIIEFDDLTEYYNLENKNTEAARKANKRLSRSNPRFYDDLENGTSFSGSGTTLSRNQISSFYMDNLNLKSDLLGDSEFYDFLSSIYDLGNNAAYVGSDGVIVIPSESSKETEKLEAAMFLKYHGLSAGFYPWYNFKNQLHSSRQFHPFIYQFIEHEALDSVVNNAFYNLDNEKILRLLRSEKLSTILGEFGNWLNVWKNNLLDYSGYMSRYENSTHSIASNSSLGISCIDYDGTFYPPAAEDFLETFKTRSEYDSNNKLDRYYYLKDAVAATYGFESFDDIIEITKGNNTRREQYKKQYEELLNDFTIGNFNIDGNSVSALVYGQDYRQERVYFNDPRTYRDWELDRIYAMGQVSSVVVDGNTYTIYTGRLFGSYSNGVELSNCLDETDDDYNNFYDNQTNKTRYESFGKLKSYWSKWYSHLTLKPEFRRRLRFQIENYYDRLSAVIEPKRKIPGEMFYDIYAYGLDKYKNSYILYKHYIKENISLYPKELTSDFNINSYEQPEIIKKNTPGELWFKYKDHPIGFPAFGKDITLSCVAKDEDGKSAISGYVQNLSQISIEDCDFIENHPNEDLHDYLYEFGIGSTTDISTILSVSNPFDILIWLDSTGSMPDEIDQLKASIVDLCTQIRTYNSNNKIGIIQFAAADYLKDFTVANGKARVLDFTDDLNTIKTYVRTKLVTNWSDECIWSLTKLPNHPDLHWRPDSKKLLIAISDEAVDNYTPVGARIAKATINGQPVSSTDQLSVADWNFTNVVNPDNPTQVRNQYNWGNSPTGASWFGGYDPDKINFENFQRVFNDKGIKVYYVETQIKTIGPSYSIKTQQQKIDWVDTYVYRIQKDLLDGISAGGFTYSIEPEDLAKTLSVDIFYDNFKYNFSIGLPIFYDFEFTPNRNGIILAGQSDRFKYDYNNPTLFANKIEEHLYFTSFVYDNAAFSPSYRKFSKNEYDFLNGYDFLGFYLNDSSLYAAYLQKNIENNLITSVDFNVVQFIPENPYVPVQFKYDNRNNRLRIKMSEPVPKDTEFSLGYSNGRFSLIYSSDYRAESENLNDLSIQNYIGYNSYSILSGMRESLISAGHDLSGWTFRQLGLGDLSSVEKIDTNATSFDRFKKKLTYINIFETFLQDPVKASESEKPYAMNYVLNSDASYIPLYSGVRGQIKVWSIPSYDKSKQQSIELLGYEYHDLDDKYSEETKGIFYDDKFGVSTDMALNTNFDATLRVYEDFDPNDYVKIIYNKFIPPIPYEVNGQETNPNQFIIEQTGFDLSGLTCTNINDLSIVVINTETPNAKPILSCPLSAFKNPNSLSINYNGNEITESEQFIYEHGYPDQENTRVYGTLNVFDSDPYNEHMSDLMSKSIVNRIFNVKDILILASGINSTNINDFRLTLKFVLDRERLKTSAFRTTGMAVSSRKLAAIIFDTKLTQFEKYHYLEPFDKWPYFNFDGKLSNVLENISDELDLSTKYAYSLALFGNTKATINGLKRVFKNMNLFDKQLADTKLVQEKLEAFFMKTGRKFLQNGKIAKNASGTKYDEFNIANGVLSTELENLDLAKYTIINQLSSVPYIRTNQITFKQSEQDEVQHTYPMLVVEDIIQDIFKRSFGGNEVKQNNIYQLSNTYIFQLENPFRIANILSSVPVPRYSYREHYARVYEEYIGAQFSVDINGPDLVNYVKLYHDISGDYKSTMPLSDLNAAHLADHTNVYTKTASGTNIITPTMPANGQFTGANATISANVAIPPEDGPRGEFGWPTRFMTVGGYNNPRSFADESRDTLSPPIPDGYNYTVDNSDASFEEVEEETLNPNDLQTGHIDIADSNIFVQMAKHKTTAREIDDFLKLYVCYKYVGENDSRKTIRLYFNTQNMTNTPYLYQREDGLFASEYKAKTSLVLDSGSDGILNVVLQYRFIDIYGDVQGVSTVPVARYHIYNVSDDKPKFLISRIWSITDNADDIDVSFYADFATVTPEHKYYGPEFLSSFVSENFKLKDDILCYNTFEVESNNGISALTCDFIYDTGYTSEGNNEFALVKPLCENVKSITFGNGYTGDIDGSGYASIVLSGYRANIGFILKEGTFIPPNTFKKNYNIQLLSANAVDAEGNRVKVFVKHGSMLFDFIGNNSLLYGRYLARELNYSKTEGPLKDSRDVLPTTNNKDNNSGWILTEAEQKLINIYNGGNDSDGSGPYGSNDLQFIIMLQDGNKLQFASNTNRYSAQPVYM